MDKTRGTMFNKIGAKILLERGKRGTYAYLGVTFKGPRISLWLAACARLSCGYASVGALERKWALLQFQGPQTKLWLFDTLVTPTLIYGVETWGLSLREIIGMI